MTGREANLSNQEGSNHSGRSPLLSTFHDLNGVEQRKKKCNKQKQKEWEKRSWSASWDGCSQSTCKAHQRCPAQQWIPVSFNQRSSQMYENSFYSYVVEATRTMASNGPLSVLLAVITLLWRAALSGAEIAKAHRMQALPATHNSACTDERSAGYQWLISMI